MSRKRSKPLPVPKLTKSQELKDAQSAVHSFQLALEQGLPTSEAYEFLVYDLIDAVRYEDVVFLRNRLIQKGYDDHCGCETCAFCVLDVFLQEIEDDLL